MSDLARSVVVGVFDGSVVVEMTAGRVRTAYGVGDEPGYLVGRVGWPRLCGEIDREWAAVQSRADRMTLPGAGLPVELDQFQEAELGVWAAAAWSLGEVATAPMTRVEAEVTWDRVESETDLAQVLSRVHRAGYVYATGVLVWMRWIVGDADTVRYPR